MKKEELDNMDADLKDYICRFISKNFSYDLWESRVITDELEQYLKDNGFDMGSVVRYELPRN